MSHYYHPELGSGEVEYHADRPIIHFATPVATADARVAADRLRARGFIIDQEERK